ncbi:MAG: asparagine synthase (glutamine-hydrolyzing), partial [Candidatus Krumholzibacteria bacterium]|nr:asparagine synthase (glutamine-hydrolyzing) [Candidatus Krumholzibacteria bacterium]
FRFTEDTDDTGVVARMNARLVRRGPDDEGVVHDGAVTLGNRRLAILDLTAAGHQPMPSATGRFLTTYNGEIYNHAELADELGLDARRRRSRTDTEVILWAWERWGAEALDRMVGQWAIAIYDREARRLWLARDRFGEKPLFYHRGAGALAFASSIPALLEAPWAPREIDPDALVEYVTLRYVVAPRTILAGVEKLQPGHLMRVDAGGVEVTRWYAPRFRRDPAAPRDSRVLAEAFGERLERAAQRCLVSDVPVALLLSDGIDSHAIRHALRATGRDVSSYTFAAVADGEGPALGGTNADGATEVCVPARDRIASLEPALGSLTEPVGDGAALATWLLIRGARERATVFLCGHGGDEVLGGYRLSHDRFRLAALRALAWLPAPWMRATIDRYVYGHEPTAERWRRLRRASRATVPDAARYLIHRPLAAEDLRALFGNPAGGARDRTPPVLGAFATIDRLYAQSTGARALDRIQEVMLATFLSTNILTWADAVAMDASAELRMPFLDRDVVDFALTLPPAERVARLPGRANTKMILRRWGRGRLDQAVLSRGKRGFPFGNVPQLLASDGERLRAHMLDAEPVRRLLPGLERWLSHPPAHYHGAREDTLWALLALGIWCAHAGVR